ncbi:TetR/AcrR family transcriptional regulator [Phenylobacterium sp.]|jgi:AcrR family transcriptional regulator|uniref:TetR/AcrR family transcriptional regulator n=1 Tax=Phenylobacterium sp. TaxID=1871053 RepID=UPI0035AF14E2
MSDIDLAKANPRARRSHEAAADSRSVSEKILDSAEIVLRRHGYAGFSTRRVAQEAAIALGNLTYHYPTKPELVQALISRLITRYLDRFQQVLRTPGRGVEDLVRWLLEEAVAEEAMWLFRELWAMALHDEIVREAIDDLYDELMGKVAATLEAAYPSADPQAVRDLVQFIALISEGSTVLYGTRRSRVTPRQRMIDLAVRLTSVIAPELAPGGAS